MGWETVSELKILLVKHYGIGSICTVLAVTLQVLDPAPTQCAPAPPLHRPPPPAL